ncbi:hypothetical protein [Parasphingopyxis sp.]|uniref:hypothetical protein n=1 Tax=Parasphingopyxis sp. TaxID=1920299 RepID=UPI0026243076|nr:hypothetical protein [Parasphingopyxis sp.]
MTDAIDPMEPLGTLIACPDIDFDLLNAVMDERHAAVANANVHAPTDICEGVLRRALA